MARRSSPETRTTPGFPASRCSSIRALPRLNVRRKIELVRRDASFEAERDDRRVLLRFLALDAEDLACEDDVVGHVVLEVRVPVAVRHVQRSADGNGDLV